MKWKKTLCACLALMLVSCSGCSIQAGDGTEQTTNKPTYENSGTTMQNPDQMPNSDADKLAYYEKLVGELQADLLAMQSELFATKTEYEERIAELEAEKNGEATPQTKDFTYTVSENSVTVTGYKGSSVRVEIPSVIEGRNVVAIGDKVFQNNKKVQSIVVPEGVKTIGWFAFSGCISLGAVTMPASVESISYGAFENCPSSLTVFCPSDSYAWQYAKSYGIATSKLTEK